MPSPFGYRFDVPDWDKWSTFDQASLWEAACLAANLEPPQRDVWYQDQLLEFPGSFRLIWEAVNRDDNFSKLPKVNISGRMLYRVSIEEFSYWALHKGINIPDALRSRAQDYAKHRPAETGQEASENNGRSLGNLVATAETTDKPPLQRNQHYRELILKIINELGYSPQNLPPNKSGVKGIRGQVEERFGNTPAVFKHAWDAFLADKKHSK